MEEIYPGYDRGIKKGSTGLDFRNMFISQTIFRNIRSIRGKFPTDGRLSDLFGPL